MFRAIFPEPLLERAERFGLLACGDIRRATTATYEHWDENKQRAALSLDLRSAVKLAEVAWCAALSGTGYRQIPCRSVSGHIGDV